MTTEAPKRKLRIAFVVQRYGERITGGAEQLCRQVAENLSEHYDIEILTTTAKDYTDWKNYYIPGREKVDRLTIKRFPIEGQYNALRFRWQTRLLFRLPHSLESERRWIQAQGPNTPVLIDYIERNASDYDLLLFFSYRYYPAFFGLPKVRQKSVLVPTAEHDRTIYLHSYMDFFHQPRAIIYLTPEEKTLINGVTHNERVESRIIGIGVNPPPQTDPQKFRMDFGIHGPFLLYVGRIDENKGCGAMFNYMWRYFEENPDTPLRLLLIGFRAMHIQPHPKIIHIGYLDDEAKFNAIAAAEAMIMPSRYESLSIVTLEAMACGAPVIVNQECEVLQGHAERSHAAFTYSNYEEFSASIREVHENPELCNEMRRNGKRYVQENYSWPIVNQQYREFIAELSGGCCGTAAQEKAAAKREPSHLSVASLDQ
ncbi:glycosyltransferase family 4 protein [Candidatus Sumerlaeota bacterium]|nr:glycosyltransferase family 4 protein [Candidatus Sumerlaeota bacterium]